MTMLYPNMCCKEGLYTENLFFSSDGEVFSFGKSARGRLGRSDEDTMTPKRVNFQTDEVFEIVSISSSHGNTLVATRRK